MLLCRQIAEHTTVLSSTCLSYLLMQRVKLLLNQSMMEGSRTGKAAEADLMVLIAKNPVVDGQGKKTHNIT